MGKYAIFDIKPTHNHKIFIQDAELHSPENSLGGIEAVHGAKPLTGGGSIAPLPPSLAS